MRRRLPAVFSLAQRGSSDALNVLGRALEGAFDVEVRAAACLAAAMVEQPGRFRSAITVVARNKR